MTERSIAAYALDLSAPAAEVAAQARLLSAEEQARADRYLVAEARTQFVLGRAQLRRVLGDWLGEAPRAVQLAYGAHGKPALAAQHSRAGITFNLSHSGACGLLAVARSIPVGVDLELIRPEVATLDIARRYFAPGEVDTLMGLPPAEQPVAFFRCWTRKEAYLKALGSGLAAPLGSFEVSLAPGDPPALLRESGDPASLQDPPRWQVWDLTDVFQGHAAAVVGEGPATLSFLGWPFRTPQA